MKFYTLKPFSLLCITLLAACDNQPTRPNQENLSPHTNTFIDYTISEEAEAYLTLAEDSNTETEQLDYRAQAVRLFIKSGNLAFAKDQLILLKEHYINDIYSDTEVLKLVTTTVSLLSAEIAVAEKSILSANEFISKIQPSNAEQQLHFITLKANYYYLTENYLSAFHNRIKLNALLSDDEQKNINNQKIWLALSSIPSSQLIHLNSKHPYIQSWFELAKIVRTGQKDAAQFGSKLLSWLTNNQTHPFANNFAKTLVNDFQLHAKLKKHIAVILPMQGDLQKRTSTIKSGILTAYYQTKNSTTKPIISFYDSSNESTTFEQLSQQALDDGATHIIGPIEKTIISRLAQKRELDIPVLTLNYSKNTLSKTENLFQFGLSPEDEARQVAKLAIKQDKQRAAVFYPDNEWGKRLHLAFKQHFELLGGEVLVATDYATNTNDYRRPIRSLLNLDKSAIRRTRVESLLGRKTQSEPYRRQDIDMIFLAATHRSARGIVPAFKFHHASNIATYSTRNIYSGISNRELNRDLNGVTFCDLPWVLNNSTKLRKTFRHNWPQQEELTRFFAFGVDAYHLINNLQYLSNNDNAYYEGLTGNIQINNKNRVTRNSAWAKFKKGQAVRFQPLSKIALSPQ